MENRMMSFIIPVLLIVASHTISGNCHTTNIHNYEKDSVVLLGNSFVKYNRPDGMKFRKEYYSWEEGCFCVLYSSKASHIIFLQGSMMDLPIDRLIREEYPGEMRQSYMGVKDSLF